MNKRAMMGWVFLWLVCLGLALVSVMFLTLAIKFTRHDSNLL